MKIYRVHEEFFAQKKNAIAYAVKESAPDWEKDRWEFSGSCFVEVFDCDSKEKIVNLLNAPAEKGYKPERSIEIWHDMMASEVDNEEADIKTYIKEGAKE